MEPWWIEEKNKKFKLNMIIAGVIIGIFIVIGAISVYQNLSNGVIKDILTIFGVGIVVIVVMVLLYWAKKN